jgi:flagellar biosynthesis protein FlhF
MRILKFEGATMRDAIAKVKAELGDQAVVIATRQVRRGLLGTGFEISAAIDDGDENHRGGPISSSKPEAKADAKSEAKAELEGPSVEKMLAPLRSELRSLRALVRASDNNRGAAELRSEIQQLRQLVENLRPSPPTTPPPVPATEHDVRAKSQTIPGDAPLVCRSTGRILMFVGPTGAGKTTTIAKLAANAALVENKRVQLVTLDTYRVGGIDQIRTFADLIGIPLQIAENPEALAEILADDTYDLTLIDTAGRSPRDTSSIDELAEVLPHLPPIEVHLVVPAASEAAAIDELAHRYHPLAPKRLLFTKLDEVERSPELAIAPARTRLPITWITTGQAVPEDIEEPTRARVLELAASGLPLSNHRAA